MDGAHRARLAGRHGVEHGDDLVAEYFADDDPVGVVAVGALDQVVHGDRPLAFGVGFAGLPGHTVGMAMDQLVQAELVGQLDGDDAIRLGPPRRPGRASSVVLPASVPPEMIMFSRARTAARKKRTNSSLSESARSSRVASIEAVPSDGHARSVGDLDHGREPVPTGEVEVDDGLGAVDAALAAGVVRPGGSLDQFDQVLVAVRDGLDPLFDSIGAFDPDVVGAVDVDVLDVVLVQEELESTQTQLGGHQAANDLVLFFGARRGDTALDHGAGRFVDGLAGQLLDERAAIDLTHSGGPVVDNPLGHVLGGIALELAALGVVHCCAFPFDPAPTVSAASPWSHTESSNDGGYRH